MSSADIEAALGHRFADPALLETALTHPAWAFEHPGAESNQRLEFLGDAVVGLLLARALYARFPKADEGALTRLRASLASGEALARKAASLGLGAALRLNRGQTLEHGERNAHNLADAMEAVLGAVLLDGGFPAAEAVFARLFADDVAALSEVPAGGESPKSALQVLAARTFRDQPAYRILSQDGPPDAPSFVAEASVAGRAATGAGRTKQAAQTAAAAALLALLREEPSGPRAGRPPCGRTGACGRIDPVSPQRTSAAQP